MPNRTLQKKIRARIHSIEPCALIKMLLEMGYTWDQFFFKGDYNLTSTPSLCRKIDFHDNKLLKVTITLNLGLLSPNTSLPSYFFREVDQNPSQGERFLRFLGYFNHFVLKDFLQTQLFELSPHLFSSWENALEDYFCLTALNSLLTLDSLFRLSFPDLNVQVQKMPQREIIQNSIFRLGGGSLGANAILGGNATRTFESFHVSLFANDDQKEKGLPWAEEVKKRLNEIIFPLLAKTSVHLLIELIVRKPKNQLRLSSNSFLGLERIGENSFPLRLLIFYGEVTSQTPDSAQHAGDGSGQTSAPGMKLQSK